MFGLYEEVVAVSIKERLTGSMGIESVSLEELAGSHCDTDSGIRFMVVGSLACLGKLDAAGFQPIH